jgi:hypothetical protein
LSTLASAASEHGRGLALAHPLQVAKGDRGALPQGQGEERLPQTRPADDLVGRIRGNRLACLGETRDGHDSLAPAPPGADLVQQDAPNVGVGVVRLPDARPVLVGLDERVLHEIVGKVPVTAQEVRAAMQGRGAVQHELAELLVPAAHRALCPSHNGLDALAARKVVRLPRQFPAGLLLDIRAQPREGDI